MISDTFGIIMFLVAIEGGIFYLAEHRWTKRIFDFTPSMFWIYFLPLLASSFKIIPQTSEVYPFISTNLLPASLLLMLISVDVRAILKLGKVALLMMFAGSLGILIGGPIVLLIFQHWLPEGIWSGFGALSGSWIGGSANMLAVKEGIGTPQHIFAPLVVVDTVVAYTWMGLLIAMSGFQAAYDRWNHSDTRVIASLNHSLTNVHEFESTPLTLKGFGMIFAIGFAGSWASSRLAGFLPEIKGVISTYTWTILIVSTLGVLLSFTRLRKLESFGASRVGFALLYLVLASIGARANLSDIASAPMMIIAGFVWVIIHGLVLLGASRLLRAPLFLVATASQANIGGPASAPVVAAVYQPALAPVGLLMAIIGNITGTYLGMVCAQLCKWVSKG
jgi:uncharacterized membrane protein